MLRVTGLKKSFGIDELFHDVSFEVARGDKVGFVGANGAGKTTLMRCLLGQEENDGGTIQLDEAATIGYVEQQADFGTGTLYEEFLRAFDDVIALGERKKALEKKIAVDHAEETMRAYSKVVERFELLGGYDYESRIRRVAFGLGFTEEDFEKNVAHFSGGQKTRICLTKALLREPDFLFLDEPTSGLDLVSRDEILDIFISLSQDEGKTVFCSTHITSDLDRCADNIIYLKQGRIAEDEPLCTLLQKYSVVQFSADNAPKNIELIGARREKDGMSALVRNSELPAGVEFAPAGLEDIMVHIEREGETK